MLGTKNSLDAYLADSSVTRLMMDLPLTTHFFSAPSPFVWRLSSIKTPATWDLLVCLASNCLYMSISLFKSAFSADHWFLLNYHILFNHTASSFSAFNYLLVLGNISTCGEVLLILGNISTYGRVLASLWRNECAFSRTSYSPPWCPLKHWHRTSRLFARLKTSSKN